MNTIIQRTFGGLSKQYYVRQFLFGLIFPAVFFFIFSQYILTRDLYMKV